MFRCSFILNQGSVNNESGTIDPNKFFFYKGLLFTHSLLERVSSSDCQIRQLPGHFSYGDNNLEW